MKNLLVAGGLGLALMFGGVCNAAVTTGHRVHTANHAPGNHIPVKLAAAHRTGMRRGMRNMPSHHVHTGQHLHHNGTTTNKSAVTKPVTGNSSSAAKPTTTSTPAKK